MKLKEKKLLINKNNNSLIHQIVSYYLRLQKYFLRWQNSEFTCDN